MFHLRQRETGLLDFAPRIAVRMAPIAQQGGNGIRQALPAPKPTAGCSSHLLEKKEPASWLQDALDFP